MDEIKNMVWSDPKATVSEGTPYAIAEGVGDKDIEFVHFNTNNDCDNFLNFASQKNMSISHKCCDGNGCGIENIKKEQLNIIIKEYLQ